MGIKVESGEKRTFSTGAKKQHAEGKGTPVLVPGDAILEVAKHFEEGAAVHGARNWEKGIPLSELLNSLERHLQQEKLGMTDEKHSLAIAWNAIVYLATKLRIERGQLPAELDDMSECALTVVTTCGRCGGKGRLYGEAKACVNCNGTGKLPKPKPKTMTCGKCDGSGWIMPTVGSDYTCRYCEGTGRTKL